MHIQPMEAKIAPGNVCLKLILLPFLIDGLNLYNKVNIKIINPNDINILKYCQKTIKVLVIPRKVNNLFPNTSPNTNRSESVV